MKSSALFNSWIAVITIAIVTTGCRPLRSAFQIDVPFEDTAEGLKKGDNVYLLGVPVGEIETPSIRNGRPIVPLLLRDDGVFGQDGQVLFYIAPDPAHPGRQSLVAVIRSAPAEPNKPRFRGFSSRTKLMLQTGAEKLESWWNSIGISK